MSDHTVKMCSRRTIMDGEVVTFAPNFMRYEDRTEAVGPFEVSASRDAVVVHHARFVNQVERERLIRAIRLAYEAHDRLSRHRGGGAPSLYPSEPTECKETDRE